MLLGTDQLVFSSSEHPAMSLQLCDMTRPLRPLAILDFWLDNVSPSLQPLTLATPPHPRYALPLAAPPLTLAALIR